jgi:tetratricopeptide (TPR) repeat protein
MEPMQTPARRHSILWILIFVVVGPLHAAPPHDAEIEMAETTYRVNADNTALVTFHQRLKSLTAPGRTAISRLQIPFVPAFQELEIKYLRTIKKDGTIVNGDPSSAFDTSPSADPLAPIFTDLKIRTLLPPNLETGDSVEYEAILNVRKWPKAGDFWFVHYLNTAASVLSEVVVLDLPEGREVAFQESPSHTGKVEIKGGRRVESWTWSNPEPRAPGEPLEALFAVSTLRSWDQFGDWIHSLNQSASASTPEITALAAKLTANKTTEADRIAALYEYVATKVRFVGVSFGIGRLQPHAAPVVLQNAYGDCKDQTALLSALLTAAGFQPHAVLVTPGLGVQRKDVPSPDQFNHEFTAIDTKSGLLFLDTSMGPVPPGVLGPGVRGRTALMIGDRTSSIIDIPLQSPVTQRTSAAMKGRINASGGFEGSARFEIQGLPEPVFRRAFLDAADTDKDKILRQLAGPEYANAKVRQISTADPNDLSKPFWVQCELSDPDFFAPPKTSMLITLEIPTAAAAQLQAAKPPTVPLPIEAVVATRSVDIQIDPSLVAGAGLPVHLKTGFGTFDSEYSYEQGHLLLKRSFQLKGAELIPADWTAFVSFMQSILAEAAKGFTIGRNPAPPSSAGSSTALRRAFQDGAAAVQRRDYEAAKRAYLEAVRLDPQSPTAWNNLGRVYAALQQNEDAERAYKRQIEINPKDAYAYNNLGLVYRALHREDEAIVWFRKQLEVSPRDRFAHGNLSLVYAANQQWDKSREEAELAAENAPEDSVSWVRLGKAQAKTGQVDQARKSFDHALTLVHNAGVENDVAYDMADAGIDLDKAWSLISGALDPEARQICQPEALSLDDKCSAQLRRIGSWLDTAAWVLYRQGKFAEAQPYLSSAYAITGSITMALHQSALYARLGRPEDALKLFSAATRGDYPKADADEARQELTKALGGQTQLEARLAAFPAPVSGPTINVLALVDEHGKVMEAQGGDSNVPQSVLSVARLTTLPPIGWPNHSFRSIRILQYRREGEGWILQRSTVK